MGTQDVLRLESAVACDLSSHLSVAIRRQAGKCGTGAFHGPSFSWRTQKASIQFSWFGTWGSPRKLPIQVTLTNTVWYWILRVKFILLNSPHYCCRGECNLFEHDFFFLWLDTWGSMAWDLAWSVSRNKIIENAIKKFIKLKITTMNIFYYHLSVLWDCILSVVLLWICTCAWSSEIGLKRHSSAAIHPDFERASRTGRAFLQPCRLLGRGPWRSFSHHSPSPGITMLHYLPYCVDYGRRFIFSCFIDPSP